MILVISTCREKLSELEFVKPVTELTGKCKTVHFEELTDGQIKQADKIIICGTALKDFDYLEADWSWIKVCNKPVLGICSGLQIIGKAFGFEVTNELGIGVQTIKTKQENKLCEGEFNAYFLHSRNVKGMEVLAETSNTACFMKIPNKEIYGCTFHPEVLNKEIIAFFAKNINT